ncbi:unnamed protein product [Rhizoctonia solani]|uniref:F-box domain-containing protein n=1 Tax=Rhizoctonia solani TaxID=456999 RepID=A0A8H3DGY1_9AGAM|nr:unnamed protein product [Rhizoctonia solani]
MFSVTSPAICPAIQQWEASALAFDAVKKFLELSISLETDSLADGAHPTYLATRIDFVLEPLRTTLTQQVSQLHSKLSQMRNMMLPYVHRLPEEVLSRISMHAIYDPLDLVDHLDPISMERCVINTYRALHNLLGVCTRWRKAILGQGALWSFVPLFDRLELPVDFKSTTEFIVDKTTGMGLHLTADLRNAPNNLSVFSRYISRFDAITLVTPSAHIIPDILGMFTSQNGPETSALSCLSVYRTHGDFNWFYREDYAFQSISEAKSFNQLVKQMSLIQMRNVPLYWSELTFSNRLTRLCLQEVNLGYDTDFGHLLNGLSSAIQLRELKFIKLRTAKPESFPDPTPSQIWLPHLQSFLVQDLHLNTLRLLLLNIKSRSHRLSLVFTRQSIRFLFRSGVVSRDNDISIICELLESTPVHALLLDVESLDADYILSPRELRQLMVSVPSLETLWVNMWDLDDRYCEALQSAGELSHGTFPSLVNLYFTCVDLSHPMAFKNMVNSHSDSLRLVTLGGSSGLITRGKVHWISPQGDSELVTWLRENVPKFKKTGRNFGPPEFRKILWELW